MEKRALLVDAAYSANKSHSAPIPFFFESETIDPDPVHWTKPAIVLIDELSVSCADFVPAVLKANGTMPVFGQRTMGGGGNVEGVATLTHTRARLNLSRGLATVFDPSGAYPEARFIEDNGVVPDVVFSHTLADFRGGYVAYVRAFNAELAKSLK
jgi:C-terminal processing protease CtpA/Prc